MASAGARAYNGGMETEPQRGSSGQSRRGFVFTTVIFNGSAAVLHGMMYYSCFSHLTQEFNVAHFPF